MDFDPETRSASFESEWRAVTDEHEHQAARAEETLTRFAAGQSVDPLAVVGAYRSGKTQFLYHLFSRSWDAGIPAFYIGDPGQLLTAFSASAESDLTVWLQARLEEQLAAFAADDPAGVSWFPNVDSATKEAFVASHDPDTGASDSVQTTLLFDEVEQSYRDFIRVMDEDDDNPLRKINDGLQDSMKVWSFGMISALEFIGEADWGRMREVRIPPLHVADVRDLLATERPQATPLANFLWWLARGRTGLIIKFVDDLPPDLDSGLVDWVRGLADTDFRETTLLNSVWTDLDRTEWEPAIRALQFDADGFDDWLLTDTHELSPTTCQHLLIDSIKEAFEFAQTATHQTALEILDRNIERVVGGLACGDSRAIPAHGFTAQAEATALLALVRDVIVSFEPATDARSVANEALDEAAETLHIEWERRVSEVDLDSGDTATLAPSVLRSACPPIAVNPDRVCDRETETIQSAMDRGLRVDTNVPASDTVEIRLCPTERTYRAEIAALTDSPDIAAPTLLVVPGDGEFDHGEADLDIFTRHNLLSVTSYRSTRFWTFVVNLHGRLDEDNVADPYSIDEREAVELRQRVSEREVENTIETLYNQLRQVAIEESRAFEREYRATYSLPDSETPVWDEDRLDGTRPYWSSGKFIESTISLSYLLVFGPEFDRDQPFETLHEPLQSGLESGLVAGGTGGFQFKSYLKTLFTETGYAKAVRDEREYYRANGGLAPAVSNVRDAVADLATTVDTASLVQQIDDRELSIRETRVPVVDIDGLSHQGAAFLRALLVSGLTTCSGDAVAIDSRLDASLTACDAALERVADCKGQVRAYGEQLQPPDTASVGTWITLETTRLDQFEQNIKRLRTGVDSLRETYTSDPTVGPLAYHYWSLLEEYMDALGQQLDQIESALSQSPVTAIVEAREHFDDIHSVLASAPFVERVFEDRDTLVERLEAYGARIFDLRMHLEQSGVAVPKEDGLVSQVDAYDDQVFLTASDTGLETLSLPGDMTALEEVNRTMQGHAHHLSTCKDSLEAIEARTTEVDRLVDDSLASLTALTTPDQTVEGQQ